MTGIIQKEIIRIGKERGFVVIADLKKFYSKNILQEMNKLVIRGLFEKGVDEGIKISWKIKKQDREL